MTGVTDAELAEIRDRIGAEAEAEKPTPESVAALAEILQGITLDQARAAARRNGDKGDDPPPA